MDADTDEIVFIKFDDGSGEGWPVLRLTGEELDGPEVWAARQISTVLNETSRRLYTVLAQMDGFTDGQVREAVESLMQSMFELGVEFARRNEPKDERADSTSNS